LIHSDKLSACHGMELYKLVRGCFQVSREKNCVSSTRPERCSPRRTCITIRPFWTQVYDGPLDGKALSKFGLASIPDFVQALESNEAVDDFLSHEQWKPKVGFPGFQSLDGFKRRNKG
jgi:hypothetical protein